MTQLVEAVPMGVREVCGGLAALGLVFFGACEPINNGGGSALPDATPCPGDLAGPAMIPALVPPSGSYCIDSTEVTQAQYEAFLLDAADNPPDQADFCAANDSYLPRVSDDCAAAYAPDLYPNRPVACVDWCDAAAYCSWAGKRLCGRVGGGALQNTNNEPWQFTRSQWYNACSDSGLFQYPYGDSYRADVCNGYEQGYQGAADVDDEYLSGCHGVYSPYKDLLNMSGNVAEWEDGCGSYSDGQDFCYVRGGSYMRADGDDEAQARDRLACRGGITGYYRDDNRNPFIGFRCCLD